jgi:branched-chain amino acid transport system permease protein
MKDHLRNGFQAGTIFGVTAIFLVLIGFNVIAAQLIGDILHDKTSGFGGLNAAMINMLIFFGLMALWAGARGAKRTNPDTWWRALSGAGLAGLVMGLSIGVLAFIIGSLNQAGVRMSNYLSALLPASINLFLLGKTPLAGASIHFVWVLVIAILGGVLARGIGRGPIREKSSSTWNQAWSAFRSQPGVQGFLAHPLSRYLFYGLLLLFVFLVPLRIGQYWNYTLGTVGIYVLLGLGLNIVVGLAGLLDLGYVAFFAIGAYSVALLTAPEPHHLLWSFWIALPIGIVLAALAGVLLGIPVLRMRGDYLAIVTLGFGEIIRILSKSDMLSSFSGGPKGVANIAGPTLFGKPFSSDIDFVYMILVAVILIIFVTTRLQNSRVGRAWIAMREDETVARAMGINTLQYKLLAFAIGAAFAGLGGVLFASRNQFTGPEDHNLMVSINVLSVVIVGGMGSIPGVIAGAFALKGLPEVLRQLENYRVLAFGALLVVMMILRPEGLIPSSRRSLEMQESSTEQPPEPVFPRSTDIPPTTDESAMEEVSVTTNVLPADEPASPGPGEP